MTALPMQLPPDVPAPLTEPHALDDRRTFESGTADTVRVDRTNPRWTVRIVLEGTATTTGETTESVCIIIHDRDSGVFPVFRVWSNWQDIRILATDIAVQPLTHARRDAEAAALAEALITWLAEEPDVCLAALTPADAAPPRARAITRHERQQHQLIRDTVWHEQSCHRP